MVGWQPAGVGGGTGAARHPAPCPPHGGMGAVLRGACWWAMAEQPDPGAGSTGRQRVMVVAALQQWQWPLVVALWWLYGSGVSVVALG